ncbi:MAG: putative O-linked GlcNAc transferase-putative TPR-containing transrane protein [Candidatus Krumholzibacteriota bacterium]|nr:putative O-linked GlcNAc transferase-putative TPR-containing transrane protein [Candidatus Krumholzibacteriota bacterium]
MNLKNANDIPVFPPRAGGGTAFAGSQRSAMALTFVFALVVRLLYLAAFRGSPYFAVPIVDAEWHDAWAWGWASGTWSMQGEAFFRAPLYPFWLSLVYRVFGHDLLAARIVQAVLGAAASAALAGCGWRIRGRGAALAAGLIASLYGPMIFFDGELLISNLLLALVCGSFFFLLGSSTRSHAIAFLLLGLAGIARPNALSLLPMRRLRPIALMTAAALLPALFVTALNFKAEGSFVFIASQGGVNFYAGNNPAATGRTLAVDELKETRGSWADFVAASRRVAERDAGRALDSGEVSAYWSRKAFAWIRSSPREALAITAKKALFAVNSYELPNERDLYFERPFPLNILMWNLGWFSFPWGIVFPLAVAGVVVGLRRSRERRVIVFLLGALVFYALSLIPFFICSRFRMGIVPPVILLAAYGLANGRALLRPAPIASFVTAAFIVNSSVFDARLRDPIQERARHGVILVSAGRIDEGRAELRTAIEEGKKRQRPPVYLGEFAYHLGETYARDGKKEEAAACFRESLALGCTTLRLLTAMARSFTEFGYPADAAAALKAALDVVPADARLWADLGAALEKSGDPSQAIRAYRRSIALSPREAQTYNKLGLLYESRAESDSSIAVWREGLAKAPGSVILHHNLALVYANGGDYVSALRELERALSIAPEDSAALSLRKAIEEDMRR